MSIQLVLERVDTTHHWICRGNGQSPEHVNLALSPELHGNPFARGACPIKRGESTTRLALLDLDSHKGETPWAGMAAAAERITTELERRGLRPAPWRSSGGRGIHLYILWDAPQDAFSVRELLREALAACGFKNGTAGVAAGEVEIFPKQDAVRADGAGSMFVLPGAGKSCPLEPLADYEPTSPALWHMSVDVPMRERKKREPRSAPQSIDAEHLRAELFKRDPDASYADWIRDGMVAHHKSRGEEWGLEIWNEHSERSEKYPGHEQLAVHWESFGRHNDPVTEFPRVERTVDASEFDTMRASAPATLANANAPTERFAFVPWNEFAQRPPLQWHIKGVLPKAAVAVIYGPPGSGKTFLALDLASAISRGAPWREHKVTRGQVLYVCGEGIDGFSQRLRALAHQLGVASLADMNIKVLADAPNIFERDQALLVARAAVLAGGASVIVIDTLAATSIGANENAAEDMSKIAAHCQGIHRATGALVILVHHTGKDANGPRGSTVLPGTADAMIEVSTVGETHIAAITKMKDGKSDARYGFRLLPVTLGIDADGDFITSCIVQHTDAVRTDERGPKKRALKGLPKLVFDTAQDCLPVAGGKGSVAAVVARCIEHLPKNEGKDRRAAEVNRVLTRSLSGEYLEIEGDSYSVIG